jgi:hypothetical protein
MAILRNGTLALGSACKRVKRAKMKISNEQHTVLLHKHLTGDFGKHKWATIKSLFEKNLICDTSGKIVITEKGLDYCMKNHMKNL